MRVYFSFLSAALFLTSALPAQEAASPDFFENKVRPVLAANCYSCHSKTAVSGLRVNSREALLKGGTAGPALVPGDPEKSLLITAISHTDPKLKMPMGNKLKPEEIAALTDWVRAGAVWPEAPLAPAKTASGAQSADEELTAEMRNWWSFRPLSKVEVPEPKSKGWAKSDIDKFILARLEKEGVQPVAPADRRTLIRRVTLDLTGLPPTPQEVTAFLNDKSPDAYAKLVERLLASPAYGERWGRFWLDVVRYGEDDTRGLAPGGKGHEPYKFAYLFRDWVIRAFNDDMPFDQFVKAHLAADQMDEKQRARLLPALGFLGQGPWYYDLTEPPVARADERHERVDTTTRAFLGLTVGCARCHDHKYDPVSIKDYYALAAVFNATNYHEYPMVPEKTAGQWKAEEKKIKDLQTALGSFMRTSSEQLANALVWKTSTYMLAAWRITGEPKAPIDQITNEMKLDRELLERWIKFLNKAPNFYPFLKDWQAMVKSGGTEAEAKKLAANFQQLIFDILEEKAEFKKHNEKLLAKELPVDGVKSIPLPNGFKSFFDQHQLELKTLDREKMNLWTDIFVREMDDVASNLPRRGNPGLFVFRDHGLERQLSTEFRDYIASMKAEIATRTKKLPESFPFVHGVSDLEEPGDFQVHLRGSPYSLGDKVPRAFPAVLTSSGKREPFQKGSGRMELAEAIARHPLTARVIVNRVWRGHFGSGIVETPSNFGASGEKPVHPELLEFLAARFVESGMSIKALHRDILLSQVYQLSSESTAANNKVDPANRLYWRANKMRMEAEQIRDAMLLASGNLDRKMFGPSSPFADDFKRRTVYGSVSRFRLDDYLQLFDFPNPNITAEKRYSTNVPLQRLFFLNSDFVFLQASAIVKQFRDETSDEARIRKIYQKLFYRDPDKAELQAGLDYLIAERKTPREPEPAPKTDPKPIEPAETRIMTDSGADSGGTMPPAPAPEAAAPASPMPEPAPKAETTPKKPKKEPKLKQKRDEWTQYVRVLLSSSEFTFVE